MNGVSIMGNKSDRGTRSCVLKKSDSRIARILLQNVLKRLSNWI